METSGIINTFNKVIEDTLKTNGKWSSKRLTTLVSFIYTLCVGVMIVISDQILKQEINRYALDVFETMLIFTAALSGLTITDKKFRNRSHDTTA